LAYDLHQMGLTFILALAVLALGCGGGGGLYPDVIYTNGVIVTMEPDLPRAEAVAVRSGAIAGVGATAAIEALAGPDTEVIDLSGRTLLPGLYAAHDHFPGAGVLKVHRVDLNSPPIGRIETVDQLVEVLGQRARETQKGHWVIGRGYDDTLLNEQRHPTRVDLDRASTDHPIWIVHTSGHLGVANSRALEVANVTSGTPQPPGGVIRLGEDGRPNGVFEESGGIVSRHIPALSVEDRMLAMKQAVEDYLKQGVTTAVIAGGGRGSLRDLQEARRLGLLKFRIVTMTSKGAPGSSSAAEAGGFISGFGDSRLKIGAIKITQDGSNQGFTGYFTEPYHTPFKGDASYRGYPRRSREDLVAMVKEIHDAGYQIAIHGNGDAAIDDILFAFERAQGDNPRPDARHRIEHCQYVREDQLDKLQELGVTPSFFVGHVYYWGDRHHEIFLGPERAARISPLASALKRGIRFTVHDDTPVTPVDPLQLVWGAVNRLTRSGRLLGADQRIAVEEALRAITIDAAWQNFEDDHKGSIATGKLADFVVLSENPLAIEPERIRDIEVLSTIVGGQAVYNRASNR